MDPRSTTWFWVSLLKIFLTIELCASDAPFSRVTTGEAVTDIGNSFGASWGDYDADGHLDLFVSHYGDLPVLYRNDGNGALTRAGKSELTSIHYAYGGIWADFDNDGALDLLVADFSGSVSVYQNDHRGSFIRNSDGGLTADQATGAAVADFDSDGFLDVFISNHAEHNLLFRGLGSGSFARVWAGSVSMDTGHFVGGSWADFNNDFAPDLVVLNHNLTAFQYRNSGNGTFTRDGDSPIELEIVDAHGSSWGDYDNDGFLDLFMSNLIGPNLLYHNDGNGRFSRVTASGLTNERALFEGCSWADYDNDGYLDLFVANRGAWGNALYHNEGDGQFRKVTTGSVATDRANSMSAAWGDFDNDGFLDLFVANTGEQANFLYRNHGNDNNWIAVRCVGGISNRSGIGAKVRVRAFIRGSFRWQMREIFGGDAYGSQNGLQAHFGLGDAANVETVRIEWPSGIVQEFRNIEANQRISVVEPPRLQAWQGKDHRLRFEVTAAQGLPVRIERSVDLENWTTLDAFTASSRTFVWTLSPPYPLRAFYRAISDSGLNSQSTFE